MKNLFKKETNDLYSFINVKSVLRIFICTIIFFWKGDVLLAGISNSDSIPQQKNLLESQTGANKIYNATGMAGIRSKIRKYDSVLTLIKVLHIGDSHIKAGFLSETFIDRMNAWYGQKMQRNIFFSAQSFCKAGTKYADYAELAELDQQLISYKPDLVIISLGTNDAFSGSSRKNFYEKVNHLVNKIKTLSPASALLLTTPADALKKSKMTGMYDPLPDLQYVVSVIIKYANDHQLAYWNLHQVMGGNYSINAWITKKLATPDRIHFTQKGYTIIGEMLFEAVKNCL